MKLAPIPLGTIQMPAPAKVIVRPEGNALAQNNRFERMLWSRHTLTEVKANHEREEAERYASGWVLAERKAA
jgi:hypothetical protein